MAPWSVVCQVEVAGLAARLPEVRWPPVKGGQPNRVPLPAWAVPLAESVVAVFTGPCVYDLPRACLSRLVPGAAYEFHRDQQPPAWVTRVHVPITTNPDAWFQWEGGEPVHFAAGFAYSFDTLRPHRYANDGATDRVHLTFDVLRA